MSFVVISVGEGYRRDLRVVVDVILGLITCEEVHVGHGARPRTSPRSALSWYEGVGTDRGKRLLVLASSKSEHASRGSRLSRIFLRLISRWHVSVWNTVPRSIWGPSSKGTSSPFSSLKVWGGSCWPWSLTTNVLAERCSPGFYASARIAEASASVARETVKWESEHRHDQTGTTERGGWNMDEGERFAQDSCDTTLEPTRVCVLYKKRAWWLTMTNNNEKTCACDKWCCVNPRRAHGSRHCLGAKLLKKNLHKIYCESETGFSHSTKKKMVASCICSRIVDFTLHTSLWSFQFLPRGLDCCPHIFIDHHLCSFQSSFFQDHLEFPDHHL